MHGVQPYERFEPKENEVLNMFYALQTRGASFIGSPILPPLLLTCHSFNFANSTIDCGTTA
eukprot:659971-Pelagomonas_calceolata.AAC.7